MIYAHDARRNAQTPCLRYLALFYAKTGMVVRLSVRVLNIKFRENTFTDFRMVVCGRTDRHEESYGKFLYLLFERSRNHYCRRIKDVRDVVTRQLSIRLPVICKCGLHKNVSNSVIQNVCILLRYGSTYLIFVCVPVI
jgi:hypothetical protein